MTTPKDEPKKDPMEWVKQQLKPLSEEIGHDPEDLVGKYVQYISTDPQADVPRAPGKGQQTG
jgi:hypothetical protein